MKVLLKRTQEGYAVVYKTDIEKMKRIAVGDEVVAEIRKPRNYRFHKKFMALITLGFDNQDSIDNFEHYRYLIEMKAGHFEAVKTGKGTVYFPRSISFSAMDDLQFQELYDKVADILCKELDLADDILRKEVQNYL